MNKRVEIKIGNRNKITARKEVRGNGTVLSQNLYVFFSEGPRRNCAETDHLQKVRFSYRNLTKIQISSTQTPHMIRYVFAGAKKIRKKNKH